MWTRVIMSAVVPFLDGHVHVIFQHVLTGECLMWTHALVTVIVPLLGGHVQVNQHILSMGMFDVNLEIDNEGRLKTKRYEKRDDFNFPFISRNIPVASAYEVYISQLIQYSRACGSYQDFLDRWLLLTRKLLSRGFLLFKLKSSLRKFYGRHHDLGNRYEHPCHKWPRICSTCRKQYPVLSSFMTNHRVCN
jgi:hypothetical protein